MIYIWSPALIWNEEFYNTSHRASSVLTEILYAIPQFQRKSQLIRINRKKRTEKTWPNFKEKKNSPVDVFCSQCPIKQQIADINLHNLARAVSTKTRLWASIYNHIHPCRPQSKQQANWIAQFHAKKKLHLPNQQVESLRGTIATYAKCIAHNIINYNAFDRAGAWKPN